MKTTSRLRIARRIAIGGLVLAAVSIGGPPAMATKGNCNPAPDPFNVQTLTKGNGTVTIDARYGWDGVSVFPDCAGPILRIRVTNTGTQTWYAHVLGKKGQPRTIAIPPGTAQNYTGAQLTTAGIETLDDLSDLTLTLDP